MLRRKLSVLLLAAVMMLAMTVASSGVASAAETYKGKGNGNGWVKNNDGAFPGGGNGGSGNPGRD